jgi:Ca2+-binding RTX toxin-like protein
MATFTGTVNGDAANAGLGILTGFTGGTLAQLQDGVGDIFQGNGGNDTISAGGGNDTIDGGAGDDSLLGNNGDDVLTGGAGLDTFNGGAGFDALLYSSDAANGGAAGVTVNLQTGTAIDGFGNIDTIIVGTIELAQGTNQNDTFIGFNQTNGDIEHLVGLGGNDTLNGGGGFDEVRYDRDATFGGGAAVTVNLVTNTAIDGFGNTDTLISIEGARGTALGDTFIGNSQNNQFTGLGGADTIDGGGGFDELRYDRDSSYSGGGAAITATFTGVGIGTVIDGFGATDSFISIEAIRGTQLADTFIGSATGTEDFFGLGGNDTLNGGAGPSFDWARYDRDSIYGGGGGAIIANLATGTATDGFGNTDTLISIEGLRGGAAGDRLTGDANGNSLVGEAGNDTINGGDGFDTALYSNESGAGAVNVNLRTGVAVDTYGNSDTLSNIEQVNGTNGNDTIVGSDASETFIGNNGNDSFNGGGGLDFMRGGAGNDTLNGAAGTGVHADQASGDADTASYNDNGVTQGVNVNLDTGVAIDGFGNTDTLIDIERVRGTNFADTMLGSNTQNLRQERFEGLGGNDMINGQAGFDVVRYDNDAVNGGGSGVTVNLAAGTATDGFGNTDTLISIEGVFGTQQTDFLSGDASNNNFRPFGGSDVIDGGGGIDTIQLYYNDNQIGGAGAFIHFGFGSGIQAAGDGVFTFTSIEAVDGSYRNDTIIGGVFGDNLFGDLGNDSIDGGDGDDTVNGGAGADTLIGGAGSDWIGYVFDLTDPAIAALDAAQNASSGWLSQNWNWTGVTVNLATGAMSGFDGAVDVFSGFENVFGTYLNDSLTGDAGDNRFRGYAGNDTIDGGGGNDTIVYSRTASRTSDLVIAGMVGDNPLAINVNLATGVALDGNGGTDTLTSIENVVGGEGNDTIFGSAVSNVLAGGNGDDLLSGGAGVDTLDGGAGTDTVTYAGAGAGITARLDLGFGSDEGGAFDTYVGVENVIGTAFNDVLVGQAGVVNRLEGGNGDDFFTGEGIDIILGGAGNDTFFTGAGAALNMDVAAAQLETVWGGFLADRMDGAAATANLTLIGQGPTADTMIGGAGNDFVYFRTGDQIAGGAGSDWAVATFSSTGVNLALNANGFENAWGSTSNDTLSGAGAATGVVIIGDSGNDLITGGDASDFLYGFADNDTIKGGLGNDIIDGGAGNDRILYDATSFGTDLLYGFAIGQDQIQFAAGSGVTAFGQLTITVSGGNSIITSAATGASQIWVLGVTGLTGGDFLFA